MLPWPLEGSSWMSREGEATDLCPWAAEVVATTLRRLTERHSPDAEK